ncbi:branched-chain amino acid ABC transporter permease [Gemmobacter denitrificans]|uniref:Branched-chain amino acid ABC transporter permease n=1 Tax=Gemmobacter denitrificans TaxID=3123040 RepID=A0ABU8BV57_9RHOB
MRHLILWAIAGAALALMPFVAGRGLLVLGVEMLVLIALAQAWNLLAGYGGLLSLGHHALFGVGGYALYAISRDLGLNPYTAIPFAGLSAAALALVLAPILFRLRDVYFAVGMWVAAEILRIAVSRSDWLGGASGLPLAGARSISRDWMGSFTFWSALALALGMTAFVGWLMAGRFGLRLRALRDDEVAARSIGVGPQRIRLIVFLISAAGAGMAGAISFLSALFITPMAAFDMTWMVTTVFVCIIGGIGRLSGPILGTALYFTLRETLSFSPGATLMAVGAAAIAVMLFAPGGLAGLIDRLAQLIRQEKTA